MREVYDPENRVWRSGRPICAACGDEGCVELPYLERHDVRFFGHHPECDCRACCEVRRNPDLARSLENRFPSLPGAWVNLAREGRLYPYTGVFPCPSMCLSGQEYHRWLTRPAEDKKLPWGSGAYRLLPGTWQTLDYRTPEGAALLMELREAKETLTPAHLRKAAGMVGRNFPEAG